MEPRLFEAARSGDISAFHSLLGEDPFLLDRVALNSVDNPLHISALTGQQKSQKKLELMRVGYDICLLKGKDGRDLLHCAALKGRVDVVKEMIWDCPESLKEMTACGETALHLAVKSNQIEATRNIVFNSTLNLFHKCELWINWFAGYRSGVNVNAVNSSGFTPKDVLDLLLQNGGDFHDIHIYRMFLQAGAVKARETATGPAYFETQAESFNNTQIVRSSSWNIWKELMKEVSESSNETQNALMVVAFLIATVTYQAILSPPSGFWESEKGKSPTITVQKRTMLPGEAVMASDPEILAVFTVFNAVGFFASLAILSMMGTCVIAVIYMGPTKMREVYIVVFLMGLLFLAELVRSTMWLLKKCGVVPDTRTGVRRINGNYPRV
ncbi:hypothetical protein CRYUN_Cryun23aG0160100 [Craigia yunnanensis]